MAISTLQNLKQLCYEALRQPLNSFSDYHDFKHLNSFVCEKSFRNQAVTETSLNDFIASRNPEFQASGISTLAGCWHKC
ncbi:hypothetical protein Angca_008731, partial [Angiostrongylus cantonensis]